MSSCNSKLMPVTLTCRHGARAELQKALVEFKAGRFSPWLAHRHENGRLMSYCLVCAKSTKFHSLAKGSLWSQDHAVTLHDVSYSVNGAGLEASLKAIEHASSDVHMFNKKGWFR